MSARPPLSGLLIRATRASLAAVLLFGSLTALVAADAPALPAPVDLHALQDRAGAVFSPAFLTEPSAAFASGCDNLLLVAQAVSALIVVGGLLGRLRRDHVEMEAIAAMMLKVAFIATVPYWRDLAVGAADAAAGALGYEPAAATPASPLMTKLWQLLAQWVPPGSPYLDVLQTQSAANLPASGHEQEWGLQAWNWARGVTAATDSLFDGSWQVVSGGSRAMVVFLSSALMVCVASLTLSLVYLAELGRVALLSLGFALAPVFIAGLGTDLLREGSARYLLRLSTAVCWPMGWALTNLVSATLLERIVGWMADLSTAALGISGGTAPPIAVAAPYLAWGTLFLLVAVTAVTCGFVLGGLALLPWAMTRALGLASGAAVRWSGMPPPGAASASSAATRTELGAASAAMPDRRDAAGPSVIGLACGPTAAAIPPSCAPRIPDLNPIVSRGVEALSVPRDQPPVALARTAADIAPWLSSPTHRSGGN